MLHNVTNYTKPFTNITLQYIYLHSIHLHLVWPVIYSYNLFLTTWFLPFEADVSLEDWDAVLGTVFWATFSLDSDANSVKFVFQMKTWNIVKLFVLHYNIQIVIFNRYKIVYK